MSTTPQPPRRSGGTPMSARLAPRDIALRKGGAPIVCITAYTAPMARFMDKHVDLLLVGDSVGMVVYGMETTLGVTLDMMIAHGQAVMRGSQKACVIVDLPFGSYQASKEDAFRAAARVMSETGCGGVKLEGGQEMAETIDYLTHRGIPVMGHVGLMPQSVNTVGGFRVQGRTPEEARAIMADAKAIAAAGAFAIVVEGVVEIAGARHHARRRHSHYRHRRVGGLRRPDHRHRGYPRPLRRVHAQVRQALCRTRRRCVRCGGGLCRRRSRAALSRAGTCLRRRPSVHREKYAKEKDLQKAAFLDPCPSTTPPPSSPSAMSTACAAASRRGGGKAAPSLWCRPWARFTKAISF